MKGNLIPINKSEFKHKKSSDIMKIPDKYNEMIKNKNNVLNNAKESIMNFQKQFQSQKQSPLKIANSYIKTSPGNDNRNISQNKQKSLLRGFIKEPNDNEDITYNQKNTNKIPFDYIPIINNNQSYNISRSDIKQENNKNNNRNFYSNSPNNNYINNIEQKNNIYNNYENRLNLSKSPWNNRQKFSIVNEEDEEYRESKEIDDKKSIYNSNINSSSNNINNSKMNNGQFYIENYGNVINNFSNSDGFNINDYTALLINSNNKIIKSQKKSGINNIPKQNNKNLDMLAEENNILKTEINKLIDEKKELQIRIKCSESNKKFNENNNNDSQNISFVTSHRKYCNTPKIKRNLKKNKNNFNENDNKMQGNEYNNLSTKNQELRKKLENLNKLINPIKRKNIILLKKIEDAEQLLKERNNIIIQYEKQLKNLKDKYNNNNN